MTTNTNCHRAKIVFDPCAFHLRARRREFQRLLIKFPCAFFVSHCDRDKGDFVCNHVQTSFSFSDFSLCIISLLPSGSSMMAMRQTGESTLSQEIFRSSKRVIASSRFSTSSAALVPWFDGLHCSPTQARANVPSPIEYSVQCSPVISGSGCKPSAPS